MEKRKVFSILFLCLAVTSVLVSYVMEKSYQRLRNQARIDSGFYQSPYIGAIWELAVDPMGRPWVSIHNEGGAAGLGILEGSEWKIYTVQNSGLLSNDISSIVFDPAGNAWIGTSLGLNHFDGQSWITYTPENSDLPWPGVDGLALDSEGKLWISSSDNGLVIFDGDEWTGFPMQEIYGKTFIAVNRNGQAWITSSYPRLFQFNEGTWTTYETSTSDLPNAMISSILIDREDRVWIGTQCDGVAIVQDGSWSLFSNDNSILYCVDDLALDNQGRVWAAQGYGGIAVCNSGSWSSYAAEEAGFFPDETSSETTHIAFSEEGKAWIVFGRGSNSILISFTNMLNTKPIPPILRVLRPYAFSPDIMWIPALLLAMLSLGILARVAVPVSVGIIFGFAPALILGGAPLPCNDNSCCRANRWFPGRPDRCSFPAIWI